MPFAVIKTIQKSKPPPPTGLHLKNKETENVLPNVLGLNLSNPQQSQPQHLMVGTDYRAGRKIGNEKEYFNLEKCLIRDI